MLKAPSPFCCSGNRLINGLINNVQPGCYPEGSVGSELTCLWQPLPSGHLLFSHLSHRNGSPGRGTLLYHNSQRLLNIHYIWLPKVLRQHTALEPRCFITSLPFAFLGERGVASMGSSVNFPIWAPSFVLCFEKGEQRGKTDSARVLQFRESGICGPIILLEDWLKKTSLWTLFQTRGGCNNCNLLLYISPCEEGRNSIYLSVMVKMRDVGGLHSNSSRHGSSLYLSKSHMAILCRFLRLKAGSDSFVGF